MNSHVSVEEQDDVSLDEFDSFVFSASNVSQSSVDDSRKSEKDPFFFSNDFLSASEENLESALSNDLILCMDNDKGEEKSQNLNQRPYNRRPRTKRRTKKKLRSSFDPKLTPIHIDDRNSENLSCLPLKKILMNYPEGDDHLSLSEAQSELNIVKKLFSDTDLDTNSFDGFSDNSNSSFEGFLTKSTRFDNSRESTLISRDSEKPNRPSSIIREISNSFGKYQVKCPFTAVNSSVVSSTPDTSSVVSSTPDTSSVVSSRPTPDTSTRFLRSRQNYSKSFTHPVCSSTSQEFEKETNASRTRYQESKKENLKLINKPNKEKHKSPDSGSNVVDNTRFSSDFEQEVIENLQRVKFSDDSENDSFEGFNFDNNQVGLQDKQAVTLLNNRPITHNISDTDQYKDDTFNTSDEDNTTMDIDDFIGDHCNRIGCTISWLETATIKTKPLKITNGIVYELNEFAKTIAWEPTYIAIWILRMRGYLNIPVENDDMKKINSVIKRRKALSVTFAGYSNLKRKLKSFDLELFTLPSVERLDKSNKQPMSVEPPSEKENFCKPSSKVAHIETEKSECIQTGEKEANNKTVLGIINDDEREIDTVLPAENSEETRPIDNLDLSDNEIIFSDEDSYIFAKDVTSNSEDEEFDLVEENDSISSFVSNENKKNKTRNLAKYIDTIEPYSSQNIRKTRKGRIRKPTVKAQESYSLKRSYQTCTSSSDEESIKSPIKDFSQTPYKDFRAKLLHPTFRDDIKVIGPYCKASSIDLKLLNSFDKANDTITNGVVHELYHFFRERKASLTSLVHTLYRLKDAPIDKSHIIATMAKIHETVKVMWDETIRSNPGMPCEEFYLPGPQSKEGKTPKLPVPIDKDISSEENNSENIEPPNKKPKLDNKRPKSVMKPVSPDNFDINSDSSDFNSNISNSQASYSEPQESQSSFSEPKELHPSFSQPQESQPSYSEPQESQPSFSEPKESGPMSNTFGYEGKITRGDIVYLYTKWLKKKMESQSNVFVTDLSKDVEELITSRKVEFIRIPVGTLMSSSVKLFEEFRKLSKSDMQEAKAYLLEDWIEDIKSILASTIKKNSINEDNKEILKSKMAYISVSTDFEYIDKYTSGDTDKHNSGDIDKYNSGDSNKHTSADTDKHTGDKHTHTDKYTTADTDNHSSTGTEKPTKADTDKHTSTDIIRIEEPHNSSDPEHAEKHSSADIICIDVSPNTSDPDYCPGDDVDYNIRHSKLVGVKTSHSLIKTLAPHYKVEKIVGYRIVKIGQENVTEYRIRWVSLSSKEDSWINEADLNCPDILAEFWEALIKQRASRGKGDATLAASGRKGKVVKDKLGFSTTIKGQTKSTAPKNMLREQENLSPFFGRDKSSSHEFFNLMVSSLKPSMVDYQHEDESIFAKRVKITKGEVLNIYNMWRYENQEHLLADGNQKVDVDVLISRVKELMEAKRVRNFNASCLLDVCYRMSLMEAKLKDVKKVKEYLSGDFLELMQSGQKHQNFVRRENASYLKKIKQNEMTVSTENKRLIEKINSLSNLQRESLVIARYLKENKMNTNLEKDLQEEIIEMKKVLEVEAGEMTSIESLKKQNPTTIKELESFGVKEDVLDEILNIALKIN